MKIAFVFDRIYPYDLGGGEKRAWEVARLLAIAGHDVTMITHQSWPGSAELVREGVRIVGVSSTVPGKKRKKTRTLKEICSYSLGLFRHLLRNSYDIVECSNFPYLPCLVARLAGIFNPSVMVVYWLEVRGWKGWWKHRQILGLYAALLEKLTSWIVYHNSTNSEHTRRRMGTLLNIPPQQIKVVAGGANIELIRTFGTSAKLLQMVTAGRLVPHKRIDFAIRTMGRLAESEPELRLVIIGEGPEEQKLRELVKSLGLENKIDFRSRLKEEELYRTYAESMIFLFPSEMEGFGIVALEAMAAGTPVILQKAPQSAACDWITDDRDGLLALTLDDWVRQATRLLHDKELYHAVREQGQKTAMIYDWSQMARETEAFFKQVFEQSKSLRSDDPEYQLERR